MASNWEGNDPKANGSVHTPAQNPSQPSAGGGSRNATCYNCGAGDHYLMACPEPTRQVPAGLAAARAAQAAQQPNGSEPAQYAQDSRPHKRQKTFAGPTVTRYPPPASGPVVTRYHPPPPTAPYASGPNPNAGYYGQASQPFQQPYQNQAYPPYAAPVNASYHPYSQQPGYGGPQGYGPSIVQQSYGQPPMSAYSGGYSQPMQQNYTPQGPFNGAQNYVPPGPHTVPYQYGPQGPVSGPPQYGSNGPMQHGHSSITPHSQNQYPRYQGTPPVQASYGATPHQQNQWSQSPITPSSYSTTPFLPQGQPTFPPQYGSPTGPQPYSAHSGPSRSASASSAQGWRAPVVPTPVQQQSEEEESYEWDLLHAFKEVPFIAPHAISHPLSEIYNEETIQPPSVDAPGTTYKYVRPHNIEYFTASIRKSLHWPLVKSDPVFSEIDLDAPLVSIDELVAWVHGRHDEDYERGSRQASDDESLTMARKRSWSEDTQEGKIKQTRQDSLGENDYDLPQQSSPEPYRKVSDTAVAVRAGTPSFGADDDAWAPQPGEGELSSSPIDPTEALLASLGVTGAPKPVAEISPSFHVNQPALPTSFSSEPVQDLSPHSVHRQDSGYVSARGSYSNGTGIASEYNNVQSVPRIRQVSRQEQPIPPPPPPPPAHLRKQFEGVPLESPSSDMSTRDRNKGPGDLGPDDPNGMEPPGSPLSPTSLAILGETDFDQMRVNGRRPEPMRQVDDVTPKMKRRQPKVADAYSRRW